MMDSIGAISHTLSPSITLLVPVYNEESILVDAISNLVKELKEMEIEKYEIVLCENGSTDRSISQSDKLMLSFPLLSFFSLQRNDYGAALREGIRRSQGRITICLELDCLPRDFITQALEILDKREIDLVIGSKLARGAMDERPLTRRILTCVFVQVLKVMFGFQGTDTHGLKAFRTEPLQKIAASCRLGRDLFATELVLRAEKAGLKKVEIPIHIKERRKPRVPILFRLPRMGFDLLRLFFILKLQRS